MPHDDKRRFRKLKRDLKRAGSKRRRRVLKQQVADGTVDEDTVDDGLGRNRTEWLNGMDKDAKRRKSKSDANNLPLE
jgi:hypothetical protein